MERECKKRRRERREGWEEGGGRVRGERETERERGEKESFIQALLNIVKTNYYNNNYYYKHLGGGIHTVLHYIYLSFFEVLIINPPEKKI